MKEETVTCVVVERQVEPEDQATQRPSWYVYEVRERSDEPGEVHSDRITPEHSDYDDEAEALAVAEYMTVLLNDGVTADELRAQNWRVANVGGRGIAVPLRIAFEDAFKAAKEIAYDGVMKRALEQAGTGSLDGVEYSGDVEFTLMSGKPWRDPSNPNAVAHRVPGVCRVELLPEHIKMLERIAAKGASSSTPEDEEPTP